MAPPALPLTLRKCTGGQPAGSVHCSTSPLEEAQFPQFLPDPRAGQTFFPPNGSPLLISLGYD